MIRNLTEKRPGKRALITVALVLVLSYSALMVGNSLNTIQDMGARGESVTITGRGFDGDSIQTAYSASEAVAAVADTAAAQDRSKSASGNLVTTLFDLAVVADVESVDDVTGEMFAERMVVYTARLGVKVDDVDDALEEVRLIMVIHGGFISSVNTRDNRGSVAIRVPQSRFHNAIADTEELGEVTIRA
ncbi:MAG: DUF4349 domain-containing protein, partial [Candidatus Bathyarchaeia archaeon]